jgi:tRNA dimethylallyltransferase
MTNASVKRSDQTIYALIGPSCTFKSKLAVDLASKFPFEIISADSRLIYKGMDIGTAKPSLEERKQIQHHMIDIVEPDFNYSVALYKHDAERKINEIILKKKIPLFVGGTGLYLNSVLMGLSIPEVKPDASFRRQLKTFTQEELYQNLKRIDPKASEIIHRNDNFRTVRALEVIYKTNKLFSRLKTVNDSPFNVIWIGATYSDRDLHCEKVKERTHGFCKEGFISEVSSLVEKYGELDLFKNTIGYAEAIQFINGKIKLTEMVEKITLHTRQLVKRQMTWFRANKKINWFYLDNIDYKELFDKVFSLIQEGSLANTSMFSTG